MHFIAKPWIMLWNNRRMLSVMVRNDLRGRYAGSLLGHAWAFLYPFLFLAFYAAIYIFIFQVQFKGFSTYEYVSFLFCGLLPFLGFTESLALGIPSVVTSISLIRSNIFPIELAPVKAVFLSQPTQVVGSLFLLVSLGLEGRLTSWSLLFPLIWVLQLMFTLGLVWILSWLNVLIRDLQNTIPIVSMVLMIGSPIAYTVDMVPSAIKLLFILNPLYYLVVCYQDCLMFGVFPRGIFFWVTLGMSVVTFLLGHWVFVNAKQVVADYA